MKKFINSILCVTVTLLLIFSVKSNAASLDKLNITTDKQTVNPNTNVVVNMDFGQALGAYTFEIDYDNKLFEYVSAEGGTANDNGTKLIVTFYDTTGGTSPRSNMSATFKAKDGITTSNPTDFAITANGLANADASVNYDDITTPIIKNVVVEPQYTDYNINLTYTGEIQKNTEKDMKLTISSPMGRYYDHVRLVADSQTPSGANVKLIASDNQQLQHDIIESGWGDASGYAIGGANVNQTLDAKGIFSEDGKYTITLKLIDRDSSDAAIATKTFDIMVGTNTPAQTPEQTPEQKPDPEQKPSSNDNTKEPEELPKTGYNELIIIVPMLLVLMIAYLKLNKKKL